MPRPRNPNPQPKKYIVKQKLKNGGYHVLERTTFFDPDRRQMKILSSRLIGKLEPGQTDLSVLECRLHQGTNGSQQGGFQSAHQNAKPRSGTSR